MSRRGALRRSRQEFEAAALLLSGGFPAQAVSRAYFAAFFAAEEALLALGATRSKHSGVVSAFSRLVAVEGGLGEDAGRILRSLFELRNQADYGDIEMPEEEARRALDAARRLVDAVDAWLSSAPGPSD